MNAAPDPPNIVTRCASCGRRILGSCPEHGSLDPEPQRGDARSCVRQVTAPAVPGYQAPRLVAVGGFGAVLEATRESDGARVAIKIARADRGSAAAQIGREIEALRRIGPPHAPALLGDGTAGDGSPYLVMEYLEGDTLAQRLLGRRDPIPIEESLATARALLRALSAVHAAGYVHRDIKPDNVFLQGTARATLVDFGLAVSPGGSEDGDEDAGTAEYMAPEQCEGRSDVDARADVYAAGVVLYEMLTGRPPFWGAPAIVREHHLSRRPPQLAAAAPGRAFPPALEDLVARCLAKDRGDRYQTAAAFSAAIAAVSLQGIEAAVSAREPQADPPSRPQGKGERRTVGVLFFESEANVANVQKQLAALGGQLGRGDGGRYVAVFGADDADNPARRGAHAAEQLLRRGVCGRVRVDLAAVVVQQKRDGSRRFIGPILSRDDLFPTAADAPGLSITQAALAVLPDHTPPPAPEPSRSGERDHSGVTAFGETGPFFGREELLAALLDSARSGAPTAVTIIGDAGQGKSRLSRTLIARLGKEAADLLVLRPREPAPGEPDQAMRTLLLSVLDLPEARPDDDDGAAVLHARLDPFGQAQLAPAIALALGWITPRARGSAMATALRALDAAPGALRSAVTLVAAEALRRRAAKAPQIVVLDDAHFAGDAVLAALENAARPGATSRAHVWVCALGRPAFEAEHPQWGDGAEVHVRHNLGPLDPESAAAFCRRLLLPAEGVSDEAVRRIVERAQAIPLHLVELVRNIHREGLVRRSQKGGSHYLAADELDRLPDLPLIEWAARREMEALAPSLRSHARLIALLGEHLTVDELEVLIARLWEASGGMELPLDARIGTRRLVLAGVVAIDAGGHVRYRHALVREAVRRGVPEPQRRRIHLAAAAYYAEQRAPEDDERRLAQLAWHASEAGMADEAAAAYFTLAQRAAGRHAYLEAERLYTRALGQPANDSAYDRRAAYRGRGSMRYRIGRYHDALDDLAEARRLAAAAGDAAEHVQILLDEATALDWMEDYKRSEERAAEARARFTAAQGEARPPILEARLFLALGRSAFRASRNEEAATLLELAATVAETLGDEAYETQAIALFQLGFLLPGLQRAEDGRAALDHAVSLSEERGDQLHLASALNVRALLWANHGDKARFVADMERSIAVARALGQGTLELIGEFNFGEYLLLMDDAGAAEAHIRRAQQIDRRLNGDPGLGNLTLLDARLSFYHGDHAAVAERVRGLRARQEAARARGEPESVLAPSEDVLCSTLELSLRDAPAEDWDALEQVSARFSVGQEHVEVIETRALTAARRGRRDEARGHLARAAALAAGSPSAMAGRLARRAASLD